MTVRIGGFFLLLPHAVEIDDYCFCAKLGCYCCGFVFPGGDVLQHSFLDGLAFVAPVRVGRWLCDSRRGDRASGPLVRCLLPLSFGQDVHEIDSKDNAL